MAPSAIPSVADGQSTKTNPEPLCQIVTPVGMLGYGFSEAHVVEALEELAFIPAPTALILDSGSTDSGPSKLALGSMTCPRSSYERDISKLLLLGQRYKVPLLISSAGGDGSDEHVDEFLKIIREIADQEENSSWNLKVISIYSSVSKSLVSQRLQSGQITGCGASVPPLTTKDIEDTPRIVAQMGPEPFFQAMAANPEFDVIIGGRAYDPSPYIAFCAYHALGKGASNIFTLGEKELGAFTHMGKIMECGGVCATPKGPGAIAAIYKDCSFNIKPLDPSSRCIPLSVAAHTLYEKTRPDILHGPGGYLDLNNATYEQLSDGRTVRVRGSTFKGSRMAGEDYTVKLEGAKVTGFRTLFMGSFRDPILIPQVHSFLDTIKEYIRQQHLHIKESWDIEFHVYGLDAKHSGPMPREVFIVGEAIAESQGVATSLASTGRVMCAHASYPGQKATSGNFAMGIGGKFELETAECAEFSIYHLMTVSDGEEGAIGDSLQHDSALKRDAIELFRWKATLVGNGEEVLNSREISPNGPPISTTTNGKPIKHALPNPASQAVSLPPRTLMDIAKVVRSKNAGPYEITMDVMFDSPAVYSLVKNSGLLSASVISRLYDIPEQDISWCGYFDVALAFKATIPRTRGGKAACSGGFMEDDVHGSQQHIPLMELQLQDSLVKHVLALDA